MCFGTGPQPTGPQPEVLDAYWRKFDANQMRMQRRCSPSSKGLGLTLSGQKKCRVPLSHFSPIQAYFCGMRGKADVMTKNTV
jgi:hypothetical protein